MKKAIYPGIPEVTRETIGGFQKVHLMPCSCSSCQNADFADIEKRVMAQLANKTGVAEAMMGRRAVERGRQSGKSAEAVLELFRKAYQPIWQAAMNDLLRRIVSDAVDKAVADLQKRIDEEGCGAAMAAMKGWS